MNHQRQNQTIQTIKQSNNLYAHFPFCRRKCAYCSLYSRVGISQADRDAYVEKIGKECQTLLANFQLPSTNSQLSTVYFGGGSPALCNLKPIFDALRPRLSTSVEFTVELHPLDVTDRLLGELREGGVNRISMGVQSFDDATLEKMGRGYGVEEAVEKFALVKKYFDNAGIDLIVGFPGDPGLGQRRNNTEETEARRHGEKSFGDWLKRFAESGMKHCSVYSLQNERGLKNVPDDDVLLDQIKCIAEELKSLGLERYEISNYAVPGFECRHNLAVWRGEDYFGIGEGACGRVGLKRTRGVRKNGGLDYEIGQVSPEADLKERTIFRLRTRDGIDASRFPEWIPTLDRFVEEGLLTRRGRSPRPTNDGLHSEDYQLPSTIYQLTARGTEVCDAILAEIV